MEEIWNKFVQQQKLKKRSGLRGSAIYVVHFFNTRERFLSMGTS